MHAPNIRLVWYRALQAIAALCLIAGPNVLGQTTTTTDDERKQAQLRNAVETAKQDDENETVVLSPFMVQGEENEGYTANSTLAGTRIRTDLKDTAASISVVTKQFLKDTGVKNNQDLLVYTPSTEVSGLNGNFSGFGGVKTYNETSKLINPSNNNRVRGLDAADNTRDYFLTDIPWDSFNVGRIDLQRGPNSILFGVGSPAGIINASINDASLKTAYRFETVVDQYGSLRTATDLNYVVLKKQLAIRISAVDDREKYEQEPAFNNTRRYSGALRYDPKFFSDDFHTTLRLKYEDGNVKSNNPRTLPPSDLITPWFTAPYSKQTINTYTVGNGSLSTTSPVLALYSLNGISFQGAASGVDVRSYYNGASSSGTLPSAVSGNPTNVLNGMISAGVAGLNNQAYRALTVPSFTNYAISKLAGGSFYTDKVLTDRTVFDFFGNLLDGPNKKEWQNWKAYNADLQQTFFKDMFALDVTYDRQTYNSGQVPWLTGGQYAIGIEVNEVFGDTSANPNVGRPYVASSSAIGNNSFKSERESKRAILTADTTAERWLGKGWVSRIIGKNVFTALAAEDGRNTQSIQWAEHATTPDIVNTLMQSSQSVNQFTGLRQYDWLYYLGPSLKNASSASGAYLHPIETQLSPAGSTVVRFFNNTWNAAASVDKTAPYSYTDFNTGATVVGTQVDNPANYVGWTTAPVNWMYATDPHDFPGLVYGGEKQKFKDKSAGFTWQGYLLDGDLVVTFGWRKDKVTNYQTAAPRNATTGIAALDYDVAESSLRTAEGQSRNWSGVYHLPKVVTKYLPYNSTVTALYNDSSNFKADAPRRNLMGDIIPNPQGRTREKGVMITTMNDRLSFKANWFHTTVSNATLGSGATAIFGGGSYYMYQLSTLGYIMAAMVQDAANGVSDGAFWDQYFADGGWTNYAYADKVPGVHFDDNYKNTAASSPWQTAAQTIQAKKMVTAWLNTPATMNAQFYKFWNSPIPFDPALAKASGNLHSAFGGTSPFSSFMQLVAAISPSGSNLPVTTVDTLAEGQEFEVAFRPVRNWNMSLNFVRTFATRQNLDSTTKAYMETFNTFYSGDAGSLRLWGQTASSFLVSNLWRNNLWLPYQVALSSQGQSAPEVAPWRLNAASTYVFEEGKWKGWMIGGAARLEAARISGYRYSSSLGFLDVGQPIKGPEDQHYDLWVGYTKKLAYKDLVWHVQLNLRNVLEKTRLVPAYYEPDGSLALARIQEGMTARITNTIEF